MSEQDNMNKLSIVFGSKFQSCLEKVLNRERTEKEYLSQDEFKDSATPCGDRSEAILKDAFDLFMKTGKPCLGMSIANHRINDHKEDHVEEMNTLSDGLDSESLETAKSIWWHHD